MMTASELRIMDRLIETQERLAVAVEALVELCRGWKEQQSEQAQQEMFAAVMARIQEEAEHGHGGLFVPHG